MLQVWPRFIAFRLDTVLDQKKHSGHTGRVDGCGSVAHLTSVSLCWAAFDIHLLVR